MSGGFSPENNSTELQELFEERLQRPMGPPAGRGPATPGAVGGGCRPVDFQLEVDAEMIVYGATKPDAYVTLQGEPVKRAARRHVPRAGRHAQQAAGAPDRGQHAATARPGRRW